MVPCLKHTGACLAVIQSIASSDLLLRHVCLLSYSSKQAINSQQSSQKRVLEPSLRQGVSRNPEGFAFGGQGGGRKAEYRCPLSMIYWYYSVAILKSHIASITLYHYEVLNESLSRLRESRTDAGGQPTLERGCLAVRWGSVCKGTGVDILM
jgi:hypothetical protein